MFMFFLDRFPEIGNGYSECICYLLSKILGAG